ncbi:hypothetical protein MKW94_029957 [Papaver nudicaule]|uniref:GST N-terminal domain-containing protein n=1 Tax=Papaver nudicaule TaxID=74823 RepID=A0AA42B3F7_PAPNU|nr:hypothetical protein [Papaver nudicaule]
MVNFNTSQTQNRVAPTFASSMGTTNLFEELPAALDSTSEPPSVFDGTTRLYISYMCPYAQRVWIARNCKGLQEKIKLVPIDLTNRPDWYKEKVYPPNKVPALEHNNEVIGESLDLIKYLDTNFEGPALLPNDPAKREFLKIFHFNLHFGILMNLEITEFKSKLTELNKIPGYAQTKRDPAELVASLKKRILGLTHNVASEFCSILDKLDFLL